MNRNFIRVIWGVLLATGLAAAAGPVRISIVVEGAPAPPVRHGLAKLKAALAARGVRYDQPASAASARGQTLVVAGLAPALGISVPPGPEALAIRRGNWKQKPALLVAGSDATGLMYALLDVADRVAWAPDPAKPLSEVREVSEHPAVADRGVTIYTMQQAHFESRLHDEAYWTRYLDNLARNRFNTFQVLFAYEMDGYLYPCYPYFFDVEGFPDVKVVGLAKERQQANLTALNRLVGMVHERGMKITIGIWDHIYRNLGPGLTPFYETRPKEGLVQGVNDQNLVPFTRAALAQFVRKVPDIDNIQLLLHGESGLKTSEMPEFWGNMWHVMHDAAPQIQFEARAKGVPDDLIENALSLGLKIRMNTKYWAEQVGLPYHPTHIQELNQFDRRHDYSDMLIYPHKYGLHWTLWTSGTTRILLWGDPDYARRIAGTLNLADAQGFDVAEPLATKMAGHPHTMKPFDLLRPEYRYYDYEFERYWHFFQVFGRLSYNPETPSEVWDREFERRFGKEAGPVVEEGLHRASQILPRVIAYCLPPNRFPTTRGWAERQRQEDLADYAQAEPSDTQQFRSFAQAARDLLRDHESAAIHPLETSRWFARASGDVLRLAADAEKRAGSQRNKEFDSTLVDLKILANLALYHARRIPAGLAMALFKQTGDINALEDAIVHERQAAEAWQRIVEAAGNVYNDDLMMGLASFDLSGHWKDELVKLHRGIAALEQQREAFRPEPRRFVAKYDAAAVKGGVLSSPLSSGDYELAVTVEGEAGPMWIEANGMDYTEKFRVPAGQRVEKKILTSVTDGKLHVVYGAEAAAKWRAGAMTVTRVDPRIAHVPVRRLAPGQDLVLRATVSAIDPIRSVCVIYGNRTRGYRSRPLEARQGFIYRTTVPAADVQPDTEYRIEAEDGAGRRSRWPERGFVSVPVSADDQPPQLRHAPVTRAEPGKPLRLVAEVTDPSGVKWVRLRYRGVTQHQDFRTLDMLPTGEKNQYAAEIPGAHLDAKFEFMYLFEVMDNAGNGRIYPDLEKETPYVVVKLSR